jgi:DNA polymerase-3 subunit delta
MNPAQLMKAADTGQLEPVYFFFGEEDYRKKEALKYIIARFIPESQRKLNVHTFTCGKSDFGEIIGELSAIPMLGEKKLLHVEEIQKLPPTQQTQLFSFLQAPFQETVVILSVPGGYNYRKTSSLAKGVAKVAEQVRFDKLSAGSAKSRIQNYLASSGLSIDNDAVRLLVDLSAGDFGGLSGELEKLALSDPAEARITLEHVKQVAVSYREFSVFTVIDQIAEGNREEALLTFQELLLKGLRPNTLLYMLGGHLQKLVMVLAGKRPPGAPFFVQKLHQQAERISPEKLKKMIESVAEAERDIRKSGLRDEFVAENLILRIAG